MASRAQREELKKFLRAKREAATATPESRTPGRRRTPGMRREEVACSPV